MVGSKRKLVSRYAHGVEEVEQLPNRGIDGARRSKGDKDAWMEWHETCV